MTALPERHRKILALALPAVVNALLDMLQVMIDLVMVGRLGAAAVAAVGLGLQSLMFVFAVMSLLHVGTSALLSRFVGAKRLMRASSALSTLLGFAFGLSLLVAVLWSFGAPKLYVWFGTDSETTRLGASYVGWFVWMMPAVFVRLVFVAALNSAGDTRTPMYVKIVTIGLNALGNYLLIFGHGGFPALGVEGAAIATLFVAYAEAAVYAGLYLGAKTPYRPLLHFSVTLLHRAIRIGLPASIERMLTFGSFMLFTAVIAHFGTDALAGYQIGLRIEGLAFMPGIGFTVAAMTLMGQGLGAKAPDHAASDVRIVLRYAAGVMFAVSLVMFFASQWLIAPFTDDSEVAAQATLYLRIVALSQIPLAYTFVLAGALRGAGDTKRPLYINLLSLWAVRLIPGFVAAYRFDEILYVYVAMIADTYLRGWWLHRVFAEGEWRKIRL